MENIFINFKELNFKLAIIQELMYNQKLVTPLFDVYEFVKNYKQRKINIDEEGYEIIPEVLKYFEEMQIPANLAEKVQRISMDGGDDIYMQICPFWDGEDDVFNIRNADDAINFTNLKKVILFYDNDQSILEKFKSKGIDAEWL